ncbi:uncharacterized protein NPIL_382881 [Nephila pilipes]|uniref:Uncharacterized protein n=1 Tax=Nephila pilipes TaxID=299642 RepID=A0A8X6UGJ2_NEPPI|nr:uncharacterized protein NPIL_382881 [Nephila pilipes]
MKKDSSSPVETPEVQNTEDGEKSTEQISSSEEDLSFETIPSDTDSFHTSPESAASYDTFDKESLPSSESQPDEYPGSNQARQPINGKRTENPRLSHRMEYLARPKKDFLDRVRFERLDGVLPEKPLPSWSILPLSTKLPVARYPYKITMTKLADNLYTTPGEKMDLLDETLDFHNGAGVFDPYLKSHSQG